MFLAKYVPDPLKQIWLLPEVLSNYILSLNSKKRRRNCFLMGVSYISSSLWSPPFFQDRLLRTEWKTGGSLLHQTHSIALVPPGALSWGLLQQSVRVVSEEMADSMHRILKGSITQTRVATDVYGWWCSARRNFMCQSTRHHNHTVTMGTESHTFANPLWDSVFTTTVFYKQTANFLS